MEYCFCLHSKSYMSIRKGKFREELPFFAWGWGTVLVSRQNTGFISGKFLPIES